MEWLKLRSGLSFLNLGSGTGYLSTIAGLILGTNGINHGIELNPTVIEYAIERLEHFIQNSSAVDEFDFCHPKFVVGNCLCLSPTVQQYDRVYCGAACPKYFENYLKNLIKVGGILVMPLDDKLLQIKRISEREWTTKNIQCVSFATLVTPTPDLTSQHVSMLDIAPASLQVLCRSSIRNVLRNCIYEENPQFRNTPLKSKKVRSKAKLEAYRVRRISIPIDNEDSDTDELSLLHNLDRQAGSREMNALLNLVLYGSMETYAVGGLVGYNSDDDDAGSRYHSDVEEYVNDMMPAIIQANDENSLSNRTSNNVPTSSNIVESAKKNLERSVLDENNVPTSSNTVESAKKDLEPSVLDENNVPTSSNTVKSAKKDLEPSVLDENNVPTSSNTVKSAKKDLEPSVLDEEKKKIAVANCSSELDNSKSTNIDKLSVPCSSKSITQADGDTNKKDKCMSKINAVKKREKLDSGIVEDVEEGNSSLGNTSSSPDRTPESDQMELNSSEEYQGDNENGLSSEKQDNKSRRFRRQRKRHYTDEEQDADGEEGDSSEPDEENSSTQGAKNKKIKRKSPPPPNPCDVQRDLLSSMLKAKVKQLPLPMPLKKFVNMNRKF